MKRLFITYLILVACLHANALIVSVQGYGDIDEETPTMEITVTEAQVDPLSGETVVELKGQLLCQGALDVRIERSSVGLTDEFCCGQCVPGNGLAIQDLNFTFSEALKDWYIHYYPEAGSNEQITYTFQEGSTVLQLVVNYHLGTEDIEGVEGKQQQVRKCLKDGLLYIQKGKQTYHL